ncbi:NIPSNAP family protein [Telluribacter sp. SYSU D00476]|uniref:NIPSNAP family protein n=1 Tax=Telluribacter sp. SYSU D00476 TaxID=2811430 RepID=UPI001FF17E54|nr:NIPSNAP family protein [Telluribacter sp. SYSU D00476]
MFALFQLSAPASASAPKREFYEIRIYHVTGKAQEERMENYLKNAYLPALHRAGIKSVGVFKPVESDTTFGKRIYVLTPLKSLDQLAKLPQTLNKDKAYQTAGKDYIDSEFKDPAYARYETIIMQAFAGMPQHQKPALDGPRSERVYELRSYESPSEKRYLNKVKMFNTGGEIGIFNKLGFNAVFYGEVLSGRRMPNLMYMTTFANKASRDEHWKAFSNDPDWGKLKDVAEYKDNMNKLEMFFLRPTEYSDI